MLLGGGDMCVIVLIVVGKKKLFGMGGLWVCDVLFILVC